jgi:hypothetical protein
VKSWLVRTVLGPLKHGPILILQYAVWPPRISQIRSDLKNDGLRQFGMMIFPIWWESHKSPWFQTTNQLGCDNSHCSTLKWINKHFLNPSWHYVNNACKNGLMILLEPHVLIRVLWICPGLLGTLPCVVGLISSFYDLSNIFGSYLVNSSGSFLASPSDMEPPQEWSVLTICPKIWIFQPQLPWRSNGCCQGSLSSAFFGGNGFHQNCHSQL